jgi:hypothetical protein
MQMSGQFHTPVPLLPWNTSQYGFYRRLCVWTPKSIWAMWGKYKTLTPLDIGHDFSVVQSATSTLPQLNSSILYNLKFTGCPLSAIECSIVDYCYFLRRGRMSDQKLADLIEDLRDFSLSLQAKAWRDRRKFINQPVFRRWRVWVQDSVIKYIIIYYILKKYYHKRNIILIPLTR